MDNVAPESLVGERKIVDEIIEKADVNLRHTAALMKEISYMGHGSRETSLVLTKVQEAMFWLESRSEPSSRRGVE